MKQNKEIVEKTISTSTIGLNGILNNEQADYFKEAAYIENNYLKAIRFKSMKTETEEFFEIMIPKRQTRGIAESETSSVDATATYSKTTITNQEFILDYTIKERVLMDNVEGGTHNQTLLRLMSKAFGRDKEDLLINGDTVGTPSDTLNGAIDAVVTTITVNDTTGFPDYADEDYGAGYLVIDSEYIEYDAKTGTTFTGCVRGAGGTTAATHTTTTAVTWQPHPLAGKLDGLIAMVKAGGNVASVSGNISKTTFFDMLKAMPAAYRADKSKLKWIVSPDIPIWWDEYIAGITTGGGDRAKAGASVSPLGIAFLESQYVKPGTIILMDPQNAMAGMRLADINFKTDSTSKTVIQKREIYHQLSAFLGTQLERAVATVIGEGVTAV